MNAIGGLPNNSNTMFDSEEELLEKIQLGEDSFLELKRIVFSSEKVIEPNRRDLSDEIGAFANRKGGVLVLGVDDKTREIEGIPLEKLDRVEDYIREICQDTLKPALAVDIERLKLPNSLGELLPILRVDIPRSLWVHKSAHGYFHRVGSAPKEMPPEYLARLFQHRSQVQTLRFEEQVVNMAKMDDLNRELWKRFTSPNEPDEGIALSKLKLAGEDHDGVLRPTVAGILLASENPRQHLPNAFIQAVHYRGTQQDSNYQVDAHDFDGPLDQQVHQAMSFLRSNQQVSAEKKDGRQDMPQFNEQAVFEAIVNAVAHRDYSINHGKIRFFLFDDRLEIYSPGGLVNAMEIDQLPLRTGTRNELITNLLARCRITDDTGELSGRALMEKRGDGVKAILRLSEEHSGKPPRYDLIGEEELRLTIYSADIVDS